MRRFLCLMLIVSTVVLTGCGNRFISSYENPVYFYYPLTNIDLYSDGSTLGYETRAGAEFSTVSELLDIYFQGPESDEFYSPFPDNIALVDTKISETHIRITLNDKFGDALGLQLTIATSCLALTLINSLSFTGVDIDILSLDGTVARSFSLSKDNITLTDPYVALPKE